MHETASAMYSFPKTMNVQKMVAIAWDATETAIIGNKVELNGSPVFIKINADVTPPVSVSDISIVSSAKILALGNTLSLPIHIVPGNATNKKVHWQSANPDIARIDDSGTITAVSAGTTTITVRTDDGNKTASYDISVREKFVPLSHIMMDSWIQLKIGNTAQVKIALIPKESTTAIIWSSSDEKIASVDQNGSITAHAAGRAFIKATPEDDPSKAKQCIVQISAK